MKQNKFALNQRVEYIAREAVRTFGFRKSMAFHKVGYIKRCSKSLAGWKYYIVRTSKNELPGRMDIVPEADIIGLVPDRERKHTTTTLN